MHIIVKRRNNRKKGCFSPSIGKGKKRLSFYYKVKFRKTKLMWTFLVIFVVDVQGFGLNKSAATSWLESFKVIILIVISELRA